MILDISDQITSQNLKKQGQRHDRHIFRARPGFYYVISLESADFMRARICTDEVYNSFNCYGRLDAHTVTDWIVQGDNDIFVTVTGYNDRGRYRLKVAEHIATPAWAAEYRAELEKLRGLRGVTFAGDAGTIVAFIQDGSNVNLTIASIEGKVLRVIPLGAFENGVRKGRIDGDSFNVATMVGARGIATIWDWGYAERYPGDYHGGGATCWQRLTLGEIKSSITDSKRFAGSRDQTWWDTTPWVAPN